MARPLRRSSVIAVSGSSPTPCSRAAIAEPYDMTLSASSPVMNRTMSRSWMVLSKYRSPGALGPAYGPTGSRLTRCTRCGRPILPCSIACRTSTNARSNRLWNPIWSFTPAESIDEIARSAAARSQSIGFSQKTCLPARAAASITSPCVFPGVHTRTASIELSATSARCSL